MKTALICCLISTACGKVFDFWLPAKWLPSGMRGWCLFQLFPPWSRTVCFTRILTRRWDGVRRRTPRKFLHGKVAMRDIGSRTRSGTTIPAWPRAIPAESAACFTSNHCGLIGRACARARTACAHLRVRHFRCLFPGASGQFELASENGPGLNAAPRGSQIVPSTPEGPPGSRLHLFYSVKRDPVPVPIAQR